jgi:hypothetical protein
MAKKYLDYDGLLYFWQKIKAIFVSDVTYNSTSRKIQKTKNGSASDVVTLAKVATSGSYTDLSSKPTIPSAGTGDSYPMMDGTRALGSNAGFARVDHVHPTDTSRAPLASPAFTGTPTAPTASTGTSTTQIATTEFVANSIGAVTAGVSQVNGKSGNVTLVAGDIGYTPTETAFAVDDIAEALDTLWDGLDAIDIPSPGTGSNYPMMDGTRALGSQTGYARVDHVHPSDTSRVPTTRKVAGHALTADVTLSAPDIGFTWGGSGGHETTVSTVNGALDDLDQCLGAVEHAIDTLGDTYVTIASVGDADGVCPLNENGIVDSQYLPSYVDDVIEAYPRSGQTELSSTWLATGSASGTVITPEAGKIYVLMVDQPHYSANSQFRWGGSAYVKMNDGGVSSITNSEIDTIVAA